MAFAMGTLGNRLLAQDAAGGALPTLYAATADLPGNSFVGPLRLRRPARRPAPCARSAQASDERRPAASGSQRAAHRRDLPGNPVAVPSRTERAPPVPSAAIAPPAAGDRLRRVLRLR